ncbi:MAG TPA: sigma-70 family RNA polymerase sigma factor [Polyangia bacterium]|jgi:RNA polymerase sigma-70 factor (ECF subfamily)|nr:sigma-70 family RNA polymerase sigma factor [Polyangia bacterium]
MRQVNAAGRGDRGAAADLLDELFPRMRNLVRYLVRNDSDVEDLTQDAAMAVLRSFQGYRGEGYFERWVDRVVMRAIFGARRRRRAERTFSAVDGGNDSFERAISVPADEYLNRRHAIRLLDLLPTGQRQVVVLHHVMEMSVPEIANELEIPFETVRSRLRLARHRLRGVGFFVGYRAGGRGAAVRPST